MGSQDRAAKATGLQLHCKHLVFLEEEGNVCPLSETHPSPGSAQHQIIIPPPVVTPSPAPFGCPLPFQPTASVSMFTFSAGPFPGPGSLPQAAPTNDLILPEATLHYQGHLPLSRQELALPPGHCRCAHTCSPQVSLKQAQSILEPSVQAPTFQTGNMEALWLLSLDLSCRELTGTGTVSKEGP
jgi:hypothetical protein